MKNRRGLASLITTAAWLTACAQSVETQDNRDDAGERRADASETVTRDASERPAPRTSVAVEIAAFQRHVCVVSREGLVACWGDNTFGQLGAETPERCRDGEASHACSRSPVWVQSLDHVEHVAVGEGHTCVVRTDGHVWCWGLGLEGQLGNGVLRSSAMPVEVVGITDAVNVALGPIDSCALRADGTVACWGDMLCGGGGFASGTTPEAIDGVSGASSLACDEAMCCVSVGADATAMCWTGGTAGVSRRTTSTAGAMVVASDSVCAVTAEHAVRCDADGSEGTVRQVDGLRDVASMAAHGTTACVTTLDGRVLCGADGETLVQVPGAVGVARVAVGVGFACGVMTDGRITCWGANDAGQLGDGTDVPHATAAPVMLAARTE